MLDVDPILFEAITGSHEVVTRADAWYDGQLSYLKPLPVVSWTVTADVSTTVERTLDLVVVSDDPVLSPDTATSPLSVWGQEINLRSGVKTPDGDVTVSMGWFPLDSSDPMETYRLYEVDGAQQTVLSGLRIAVQGKDRAVWSADYDLDHDEQKPAGTTAYAEIARLLKDVATVGEHQVTDRTLGSIVYDTDSRLTALDQVAQRLNARVSWNVDGQAVLVPRAATGDSWAIPAGAKEITVEASRKMIRGSNFYNGVVSEGRDPDTQQVFIGTAIDATGPLRWGGPAKYKKYGHTSPLITSQAMADEDAITTLENVVKKRQQEIELTCVSNPALELLDEVSWTHPKGTFTGVVKRIEWNHTGQMKLSLWVPFETYLAYR